MEVSGFMQVFSEDLWKEFAGTGCTIKFIYYADKHFHMSPNAIPKRSART